MTAVAEKELLHGNPVVCTAPRCPFTHHHSSLIIAHHCSLIVRAGRVVVITVRRLRGGPCRPWWQAVAVSIKNVLLLGIITTQLEGIPVINIGGSLIVLQGHHGVCQRAIDVRIQ